MTQLTHNDIPQVLAELQASNRTILDLLQRANLRPNSDDDGLITIDQAASHLNLSKATLYGYVSRSEIPHMKRSKRLYFTKSDLNNWIKASRKRTLTEIKNDVQLTKKIGK
jgi:excisionase family DNA binding protein